MNIDTSANASSKKSAPWAAWRVISPGYFRAVGLPLIGGRTFDQSDKQVWQAPGEPIPARRVILSARLAKRLFGNEAAVGKHVLLWKSQSGLDSEVVGVVGDSRERGPASGPSLTVYLPYGATAVTTEIVLHTHVDPTALAPVIRSMVAEMDPNLPVTDVRSFEEVVARSVAPQRFDAVLLGIFSGFALVLATMGVYAVLAYSVRRRASEIGLRMALGATRRDILWMTIGQGLRPALAGIALGAIGAWWLSRYMITLLFGVKPFDMSTYAAVIMMLLVTVVMACYLPCRRAMQTDPATALRAD